MNEYNKYFNTLHYNTLHYALKNLLYITTVFARSMGPARGEAPRMLLIDEKNNRKYQTGNEWDIEIPDTGISHHVSPIF